MAANALNTACTVVDTLVATQLDVLKRINRKFAALRNLAQLLEQLGNVDELVPNIGALIPVIRVDLTVYENMVALCPYLNLPPFTTGDLNQLQVQLTGAYATYFQKLLNHPWYRMGQLQEQLLNLQGSANFAATEILDFLRCLQTVCAAGQAVSGQISALADAEIAKEVKTFAENFAASGGEVLTEPMKIKYQEVIDIQKQLIALGADSKSNYTAAKAAMGG